jgi:PAS domain S-box-containing protein
MGGFSGLLNNSMLLLALSVIYDSFGIYNISNKKLRDVITGIVVALITVAVMMNPWTIKPGMFFDTRGVILGLCGLFFGIIPTSIAMVVAALLRIFQGGTGALPGTLVVISTASVGLLFRYWKQKNKTPLNWKQLYVFGVLLHLTFVSCLITLPASVRFYVIKIVAPPILLIFPFITLFVGIILLKQEARRKTETELIENRKTLAKERGLLKGVIDTIPDLIYFKDKEGKYLGCNQAFEKYLEKEEKEIKGKFSRDFFDADFAAHAIEKDIETMGGAKTVGYEACFKTKSGKSAMFETLKTPFKGIDGILYGLVGISRDMTDRNKTQKALQHAYNIIEKSPVVAFRWKNVKGWPVEFVTNNVTKLFGYKAEEFTSGQLHFIKIIHPEDIEQVGREVSISSEKGIDEFSHEPYRIITKEGKIRWVDDRTFMLRDNKNNITHYEGLIKDITEQRKLELQLQQNQKMDSIGTLAGGIAHDLNNILFPVLGYTEMLLEDISKDSPFRDDLKEIYSGALRARDLVKQILTFSRQENSEIKIIKMQTIVEEVLKLIRSTIPTTIDIKQDLQADCGSVKADPTHIHQIIMNLATNAHYAMKDTGGELKVSLKEIELSETDLINPDMEPGSYALLIISDQGVGMDSDLTKKIFDPFFTTREKSKGTGMGLSVVHGIVKSMNGAIHVYSEPGIGTEFKLYFPTEKSHFEEDDKAISEALQGGTEKILLVDDEEGILIMEKKLLMRLGYQVTSCINSTEALGLFKSNPGQFDLVISDMAMPGLSGDKLSAELIKIQPDIPILLCTGFSDGMSEEKTEAIGIKGFLMKPVGMKDLAQKVREVLD